MIQASPFPSRPDDFEAGLWPCEWIHADVDPPFVAAWRLAFDSPAEETVRIHVSADERYVLYLDGEEIGRGPERGDVTNWFYETYRLQLSAGAHMLVARTWAIGGQGPVAQISVEPGFVLAADGQPAERFNTGRADWQCKVLDGYSFIDGGVTHMGFVGSRVRLDGARLCCGVETGGGEDWHAPRIGPQAWDVLARYGELRGRRLQPATLPAMVSQAVGGGKIRHVDDAGVETAMSRQVRANDHIAAEQDAWQRLLRDGEPVEIPPHSHRRVIIDLDDYYCAYHGITVSGGQGGRVRLSWAEGLFVDRKGGAKGNRDEIEGKYFRGLGDEFLPGGDGDRHMETLWWNAGRYLELAVDAGDEPLVLSHIELRETRYPLEMLSRYQADDSRLPDSFPIMFRTLQMCAHETYMDCPYYEQLMYAGDTRLQMLVTFVSTPDDRLPRKALRMFDSSRDFQGLTQSRYPSRIAQYIPAFSLYWAAMVYDYALWRDDAAFVRSFLPGVRSVTETFLARIGDDGLPRLPEGWDWTDWVPTWTSGKADRGGADVCGIRTWLLVYSLGLIAQLERWYGEEALAERVESARRQLATRACEVFWNESRGLMSTDPYGQLFGEHAQCFAVLSGMLNEQMQQRIAHALETDDDLDRATIYFRHYLFEAFRELGQINAVFDRLDQWYGLDALGLRTCLEQPEPSRSDCHAWGAHPIYHAFASVLGIRPAGPGFATVRIAPQFGRLSRVSGTMPHPRGEIAVSLDRKGEGLAGQIVLPEGLDGTFVWADSQVDLAAGENRIDLPGDGQ
jgi:hypothetical protein